MYNDVYNSFSEVNLLLLVRLRYRNMLDELQRCNFDRHSRRGDFQASPFRQNIHNIHRPFPSFWPAVFLKFLPIAHAQKLKVNQCVNVCSKSLTK